MVNMVKTGILEKNFIELGTNNYSQKKDEGLKVYGKKIQEKKVLGGRKIKVLIFAVEFYADGTSVVVEFKVLSNNISASDLRSFFFNYDIDADNINTLVKQKLEEIKAAKDEYIQFDCDCYGNITMELDKETVVFEKNPCDEDTYTEAVEYVLDNTEDENKIYDENNGYVIVEKNAVNKQIKKFLESKNDNTSLAKFYRELKRQGKIYSNNGNNRIEYRSKGKVAIGIAFILGAKTNGKA